MNPRNLRGKIFELSDAVKGWTKFTKFDDLDAMSEAEWDKVRSLNSSKLL